MILTVISYCNLILYYTMTSLEPVIDLVMISIYCGGAGNVRGNNDGAPSGESNDGERLLEQW